MVVSLDILHILEILDILVIHRLKLDILVQPGVYVPPGSGVRGNKFFCRPILNLLGNRSLRCDCSKWWRASIRGTYLPIVTLKHVKSTLHYVINGFCDMKNMTLPNNMRLAAFTISSYRIDPLSSAVAEDKRKNSHLSPRIASSTRS